MENLYHVHILSHINPLQESTLTKQPEVNKDLLKACLLPLFSMGKTWK